MSENSSAPDRSPDESERVIWFALPAGFTVLPLEAVIALPESEAGTRVCGAFGEAAGGAAHAAAGAGHTAGGAAHAAEAGRRLLQALVREGVVHCALGVHRDDDGRLLQSLFTVAWREIPWAPRNITAARAVTGGHTDVELLDLGCGPAALGEILRDVPDGTAGEARRLLQVHAYLPHPGGRLLAALSLSTTDVRRRTHYRALLHRIAGLTSFDAPAPKVPART